LTSDLVTTIVSIMAGRIIVPFDEKWPIIETIGKNWRKI